MSQLCLFRADLSWDRFGTSLLEAVTQICDQLVCFGDVLSPLSGSEAYYLKYLALIQTLGGILELGRSRKFLSGLGTQKCPAHPLTHTTTAHARLGNQLVEVPRTLFTIKHNKLNLTVANLILKVRVWLVWSNNKLKYRAESTAPLFSSTEPPSSPFPPSYTIFKLGKLSFSIKLADIFAIFSSNCSTTLLEIYPTQERRPENNLRVCRISQLL